VAFPTGTADAEQHEVHPHRHQSTIIVEGGTGTLAIIPPQKAKLMAAAVGLLHDGGRFVSIAHCSAISLEPIKRKSS
jgi:hypothetical protein